MGRMLGAFDESSSNYDRPDLNKCPECSCFFEGDFCPICGMECPPEYRAGNRKPEKKKKEKGVRGYQFVEWYHRWWFIILMMFFFPIVGIILLFTSPHEKWKKGLFIVIAILYTLISTFGIQNIYNYIFDPDDRGSLVNTEIPEEEYKSLCVKTDAEDFYRNYGKFEGQYVTMNLIVRSKISEVHDLYSPVDSYEYTTYYICTDEDGKFAVMIRDCTASGRNFVMGDSITVYGEGVGEVNVQDNKGYDNHTHPCVYSAYIE